MNRLKRSFFTLVTLTMCFATLALPMRPTDGRHPGSDFYPYKSMSRNFEIDGREIDLYLPVGVEEGVKVPVIVYGHGQALNSSHYEKSFIHYAKKGIAVIFPQYDRGFFDQNWERMGADFNSLTKKVLEMNTDILDTNRVVYSGHSKGAYVGLMAAGAPNFNNQAKSFVFFAPAGFDESYLSNINEKLPMSLIWGEEDNIIKKDLVMDVYKKAPNEFKQFIEVKNYPELEATHFFIVSKRTIFGGTRGLSAYHYHGEFKWLMGAVRDLDNVDRISDDYLYGEKALESGIESVRHTSFA